MYFIAIRNVDGDWKVITQGSVLTPQEKAAVIVTGLEKWVEPP